MNIAIVGATKRRSKINRSFGKKNFPITEACQLRQIMRKKLILGKEHTVSNLENLISQK